MTGSDPLIRKYQLFKIGTRLRAQDFTGALTLTEPEGTTTLSFENGEPVRATSTLVSLSLPAFLLRKRRLERSRLKELLEETANGSNSLEELLIRRQILSAKELMRLKRELSEFVFATAFHKDRVAYSWLSGPVGDGERGRVRSQMQLHEALFRAVATDKEVEGFSRMFTDRWDVPLTKSADFFRYLLQFRSAFYGEDITDALMTDGVTAQAIVDGAAEKESALRQLFALTYAGMLTFSEGDALEMAPGAFEANVEPMEEVEENKTLVFMPEDIPTVAPQTVFLGSAMPFQGEPAPVDEPAAEEASRPDDLKAFLEEGFAGAGGNERFEEEMIPEAEATPLVVPEETEVEEDLDIPVVLEDGSDALAVDDVAESTEIPMDDSGESVAEDPPGSPGTASDQAVEEMLRAATDAAQQAVAGHRNQRKAEPAALPVEEASVSDVAPAPSLALVTPPALPPRPKMPEAGTDESIERILEDVYRSMLSRNLYQVLSVSNTTPISAIRDAAARFCAKYSLAQYKGYMLSSRARKILEYVQAELERALKVLTVRSERAAYDLHVGTQYDRPVQEALAALFDAEDALLAGLSAQRQERWLDALESFNRAAELNGRDPDYLAYLGWATYQSYKSGQSDDSFAPNKARNILERALAIDARNARALLFIARIEKGMNNMEAARLWYERLHKLEPANDEVNSALEWLRMSAGISRRDQSGFWNWLKGIFMRK
jgi:tetratricopeptide (TPR) repeat protein